MTSSLSRFATGFFLAALSLPSLAANGATQYRLGLSVVELNNPCTAGPDSIDGSLDIHGVAKTSGNITFLQVNAKGSGVAGNGTDYQLGGKAKFQFHDPLPATLYVKLRMISAGSSPNAFLVLSLHVNEQGVITQAQFSGVECQG
jgi:hypothetical protein